MSAVMAVLDFHGDSADLAAARYDHAVHDVVAASSARPLMHLRCPASTASWSSTCGPPRRYCGRSTRTTIRRVLREAGMPEFKLRVYPVHNLGWPVDAMPLYR